MKKVISILVAMLLVMAVVAPAMAYTPPTMPNDKTSANACNCIRTPDKQSPDSDTAREITDAVSKELPIPDNYFLHEIPDGSGYVLGYQSSSNDVTVIAISPNYEIREIWNAVTTEIPGGYNIVLTSNKGKEEVILVTSDPASDSVKVTMYDSSGNVITIRLSCKDVCMGACLMVLGVGCTKACPA